MIYPHLQKCSISINYDKIKYHVPDEVAYAYNPSTQETEAGGAHV
jgi:hypothetical protein